MLFALFTMSASVNAQEVSIENLKNYTFNPDVSNFDDYSEFSTDFNYEFTINTAKYIDLTVGGSVFKTSDIGYITVYLSSKGKVFNESNKLFSADASGKEGNFKTLLESGKYYLCINLRKVKPLERKVLDTPKIWTNLGVVDVATDNSSISSAKSVPLSTKTTGCLGAVKRESWFKVKLKGYETLNFGIMQPNGYTIGSIDVLIGTDDSDLTRIGSLSYKSKKLSIKSKYKGTYYLVLRNVGDISTAHNVGVSYVKYTRNAKAPKSRLQYKKKRLRIKLKSGVTAKVTVKGKTQKIIVTGKWYYTKFRKLKKGTIITVRTYKLGYKTNTLKYKI